MFKQNFFGPYFGLGIHDSGAMGDSSVSISSPGAIYAARDANTKRLIHCTCTNRQEAGLPRSLWTMLPALRFCTQDHPQCPQDGSPALASCMDAASSSICLMSPAMISSRDVLQMIQCMPVKQE